MLDQGTDSDHVESLVAGEHHLGLVGDRQIGTAGRDLLDRRRGVGGNVRVDVEAGVGEVAVGERRVDTGVVGVDVEVERQVEGVGLRRLALGLLAAAERKQRDRRQRRHCGADAYEPPRSGLRLLHRSFHPRWLRNLGRGSAVRSRSSPPAPPSFEQADRSEEQHRHRREHEDRREQARHLELGVVDEHQVPEPLVGAGPLAEHGADHRDRNRDLRPADRVGERGRGARAGSGSEFGRRRASASSCAAPARPLRVRRAC